MNSWFGPSQLINPALHVQVGDLARLLVPRESSPVLADLVNQAVELARAKSAEDETTYDFIAPPEWLAGLEDVARRAEELAATEAAIDDEVYILYGISGEDRRAIELELAEGTSVNGDAGPGRNDEGDVSAEDADTDTERDGEAGERGPLSAPLARDELARHWISYAVGVVLGRFDPGAQNGLGRSRFSPENEAALRDLADSDGILVMDEGHSDDLPGKVLEALKIMVGDKEVAGVIRTATDREGAPEELLRRYLERTFFKLHIQQYRKRPVYWYFQSPKKRYGLWIFHERLTRDSLFSIQTQYVEPKIKHLEAQIAELRAKRDGAQGRERREIEKAIGALNDILDDVREFRKTLERIIQERGYRPHIDDGVLLNMAPLWELLPSWQAEPRKAWQALERGDYDWSRQAMDHWPERVKEKCKSNRSYAIAHGLD